MNMHGPQHEDEDTTAYLVVVNGEEQYSIWPVEREIPHGWKGVGVEGPRQVCLAHIEKVWTDMRPLSLRRAMEEHEQRRAEPGEARLALRAF